MNKKRQIHTSGRARRATKLMAFLTVGALSAAACSSTDDTTANGAAGDSAPTADSTLTTSPPSEDSSDGTDDTEPAPTETDAPAGTEAPVVTEPTDAALVADISADVYVTADQMLLANEINESGEPFAEALGYDLDELDPNVAGSPDDRAYTLGIENYEYSRYQLGTVVRNSGIGLHMMWAPLVRRAAAAEADGFDGSFTAAPNGVNEDDELIKTIMNFAALSNETPPGNAWPQFAEFASGDPHLPQTPNPAMFDWQDVSTMRWDRSSLDRRLTPAAMGQTLMKQYLWAEDMLSAFHDGANEGIDADGVISPDLADSPNFDPDNDVFYGGDARDGFIGMVLTAEGINKVAFLTNALAYDGAELGSLDLATYDPAEGIRYFPHAIAVTEGEIVAGLPPGATGLEVDDASSMLFDQASLMWATTSFTNMMNADDDSDSAHLAYHEAFDGSPFPASASETGTPGPFDLMKGTSKALFMNLMAMHFDPDAAVFVDEANLDDDGAVAKGSDVSTFASAYLLVGLEGFVDQFTGTPLHDAAVEAVTNQATFMIANLSDGEGRYSDAVTIGGEPGGRSVEAQAAAVRGLFVATRVTGDQDIADAAEAAYQALIDDYYVEADQIFRTDASSDTATYTPKTFALLAGALREASLEGGHDDASWIYTGLSQVVGNQMQLSESANTGETGGDSDGDGIPFTPEQPDNLSDVFASEAVFELTT